MVRTTKNNEVIKIKIAIIIISQNIIKIRLRFKSQEEKCVSNLARLSFLKPCAGRRIRRRHL